jgi:hypothetical protein
MTNTPIPEFMTEERINRFSQHDNIFIGKHNGCAVITFAILDNLITMARWATAHIGDAKRIVELERHNYLLQEALTAAGQQGFSLSERIEMLETENTRLRAMLQWYAGDDSSNGDNARAALAGAGKEKP